MATVSTYAHYPSTLAEHPAGETGNFICEEIIKCIRRIQGVSSVCELGCGQGFLANKIASLGYQVFGIDGSETGIAAASAVKTNAEFQVADISIDLPKILERNRFDLVISSEVIEHMYTPDLIPKVARELLSAGGYLIVTAPFHGYIKNLAIALLGKGDSHYDPLCDGGHIKFFSKASLQNILEANGFTVLEWKFVGRFPGLWKSMICVARKS